MTTPSQIDVSTLREGETKAAHTPGPWGVRGGFSAALEIYPLTGDGDAGPGTANSEIAEVDDVYDEYKANARLIAAAPDLLEALRRLTTEAKMDGMEKRAGWDAWISMADAAIAKAGA